MSTSRGLCQKAQAPCWLNDFSMYVFPLFFTEGLKLGGMLLSLAWPRCHHNVKFNSADVTVTSELVESHVPVLTAGSDNIQWLCNPKNAMCEYEAETCEYSHHMLVVSPSLALK